MAAHPHSEALHQLAEAVAASITLRLAHPVTMAGQVVALVPQVMALPTPVVQESLVRETMAGQPVRHKQALVVAVLALLAQPLAVMALSAAMAGLGFRHQSAAFR